MVSADFFEVAGRQRAYRQFTDAPVEDAVIARLLRAAVNAPSSENVQPWRFVVVREAGTRAKIGALIREIWEAGGREHTAQRTTATVFADVDSGLGGGGLAEAPVLIVVGGDAEVLHPSMLKSSVFPAIQNVLLGATALGLGNCLTTITSMRGDDMRELVGFPEHVHPLAVVPIGHPRRQLGPPRRDALSTKVFGEQYGLPWPGAGL